MKHRSIKKPPRKKTSHQQQDRFSKSIHFLTKAILFLIVIATLIFAYQTIFNNKPKSQIIEQNNTKKISQEEQDYKKFLDQQAKRFEEKTNAMEIEYEDDTLYKTEQTNQPIEAHPKENVFKYVDTNKTIIAQPTQEIKQPIQEEQPKAKITLPKLAIIIDDVSFRGQVKEIQSLPFPVTMSFLPPIKRHPESARLARDIPVYMVHLPLQASDFKFEEDNTLHINDSLEKIDKRIQQIKQLYPRAKYINNHTGSKFTETPEAMDKLLKTLKKYNFYFVDSKTTAHTVGKKYADKYGVKYLTRNIFLDNKQDEEYIKQKLIKAVKIAKQTGSAIAICHPHHITLQTLKKSKYLFDGVEVVLINKL